MDWRTHNQAKRQIMRQLPEKVRMEMRGERERNKFAET